MSELLIIFIKCALLAVTLLVMVPMMVWVERRGSALMQLRRGPNRVGPLGLLQSVADAIKFIFKEDYTPHQVRKFYYVLAPLITVVPAFNITNPNKILLMLHPFFDEPSAKKKIPS
jgi:NADH-quinone oxidoreductase subunit H